MAAFFIEKAVFFFSIGEGIFASKSVWQGRAIIMNRGLLILILFLFVRPAMGDDTALHEGGQGPMPVGGINGPESIIQMVSEKIEVEFSEKTSVVHCQFVFRSHKSGKNAVQLVGFPDLGAANAEAQRRSRAGAEVHGPMEGDWTGPLENVETFVNGKQVHTQLKYGWVSEREGYYAFAAENDEDRILMAWHTVQVTFPSVTFPGEGVVIERSYRVNNGVQVYNVHFFDYTTATGGVWWGKIERMDVAVRLMGGLTIKDLEFVSDNPDQQMHQTSCSPDKSGWDLVSPTELKLAWTNFEPRTDKDRRGFTIATRAKIPSQ